MDSIRILQSLWNSLPSHRKCKNTPNFHQPATRHENSLSIILQLSHNAAIPGPPMDCMQAANIILTKGNPRSPLCLTQKQYENVTVLKTQPAFHEAAAIPKIFFAAILAVLPAIEFLPGFKLQLNWWKLTWELLLQFPCFWFWSSLCFSWGSRQQRNRTQIVLFGNLDCIWLLSQDKYKTEGRLK